jgi:pimeloyl-ACP methyl ester carboxylesterase
MDFEQALSIVNQTVYAQVGRYLSDVEQLIFMGAWQGQTYEQIAETHGYSVKYLKDDSGRKFWKLLSEVFGESVGKNNFRSAIMRLSQRLKSQQTKEEQSHTQKVVISPTSAFGGQSIRFCSTPDQVRLAYAVTGQGYPLVKAANWLSHLEFDWQSPVWKHWWKSLSQSYKLIRYDERGCGLSDWEVPKFSFDAWVRDLETVIETTQLNQFALLGISQGAGVAIAYAVQHPEKISHLILYGGYAQGSLLRNATPQEIEETQIMKKMVELGWGRDNPAFRQLYTSLFIPEGTLEQFHWFNDLQRISTSPKNAAKFVDTFTQTDVCDLAMQVEVPTLVLHSQADALVPFEQGRLLASLIPNARFVPLNSKNHLLLEHEPAWQRFLSEVQEFLPQDVQKKSPSAAEPSTASSSAGKPDSINLTVMENPPDREQDMQIRFCKSSDGVRIAYGVQGSGSVLIKAGNPLTHLAYDHQNPVWQHWWQGLSQHHTFIRYDERGCGLSDWNITEFSMDLWVSDLETVVDQSGSERFALLGISQGASVAISYAIRHPERVSHLILYGGYARGRFRRNPSPENQAECRMLVDLIRHGWGKDNPVFRQVFSTLFLPEGTTEQIHWLNDLAHITASPENAVKMEEAFYQIDVTHLAP